VKNAFIKGILMRIQFTHESVFYLKLKILDRTGLSIEERDLDVSAFFNSTGFNIVCEKWDEDQEEIDVINPGARIISSHKFHDDLKVISRDEAILPLRCQTIVELDCSEDQARRYYEEAKNRLDTAADDIQDIVNGQIQQVYMLSDPNVMLQIMAGLPPSIPQMAKILTLQVYYCEKSCTSPFEDEAQPSGIGDSVLLKIYNIFILIECYKDHPENTIDCGGSFVLAHDNKVVMRGDDCYDDKEINGFIAGLKFAGKTVNIERFNVVIDQDHYLGEDDDNGWQGFVGEEYPPKVAPVFFEKIKN